MNINKGSFPLIRHWIVARNVRGIRHLSAASSFPSEAYTRPGPADSSVTTTPADLSPAQHECLDRAIRVDQAGEIAANWIYRGQMAVLGRDRQVGPVIQVYITLHAP